MQPAIKHASRGYLATPYLHECITDGAEEMLKDEPIAAIYLPDGRPLNAGERVVQSEYAETLKIISQHGEAALYGGPLGDILVDYMKAHGGFVTRHDLTSTKPSSARRSVPNIAAGNSRPAAACGFRRAYRPDAEYPRGLRHHGERFRHRRDHPSARRGFKVAFADRAAASGDPDFVGVPVERLTSKQYANERRAAIDVTLAQQWGAGVAPIESAHTTHMTAADSMGNVVATTQTINNLFGAKILIPGLGTVPNNYMNLYDPRPGHALSLAPGKRGHDLDVAHDGAAQRQAGLCARFARRQAHLPERAAGADQPDRSRHEPAGSG